MGRQGCAWAVLKPGQSRIVAHHRSRPRRARRTAVSEECVCVVFIVFSSQLWCRTSPGLSIVISCQRMRDEWNTMCCTIPAKSSTTIWPNVGITEPRLESGKKTTAWAEQLSSSCRQWRTTRRAGLEPVRAVFSYF